MNDKLILSTLQKAFNLLPAFMNTPEAEVMLIAIGLQESELIERRQIVAGQPIGTAKGLWQFEFNGGVKGVVTHLESKDLMKWVARRRKVEWDPYKIWDALEHDDVFAAAAARLLLYTDTKPLPKIDQSVEAWDYYLRVWKPGKPHPGRWDTNYLLALSYYDIQTLA
jgi:hypothetical protein